ncbi:MAG: PEP-CTERM sorting domain-containing protein [Sedimentisphaerales bacterium]|nr:PEP-CTERM sorting domain-containing protein [Sedimentisphaerales bacterium]
MYKLNSRLIVFALGALVAVLFMPQLTSAAVVTGQNSILQSAGNNVYIPITANASGELGDLWPVGTGTVGLTVETGVNVPALGYTEGSLAFALSFDISSEIPSGQEMKLPDSKIYLDFSDIDFVLVNSGVNVTHYETLSIWLLLDAISPTAPSGPADLVINSTNYSNYREDGIIGGSTNKTPITYELELPGDLGLTQGDLDGNINVDYEFGIWLEFTSRLTNSGTSISRGWYNTLEEVSDSMVFGVGEIPEPATVCLLAIGGSLVLLRRRRVA